MRRMLPALLACLAAMPSAFAQEREVVKPGEERFSAALGWFLSSFHTDLSVDNPTLGVGDRVNLHDDLGVDMEKGSFWAAAEWRFAPRHRIGLTYSRFNLGGTRAISRELHIGDEVYPAGATVTTHFRIEIVPVTYSYSFLKRESGELAGTVGVHWTRVGFSANGSVTVGTSTGNFDASNEASANGDLPLPVLGLRYDHHFSRRWSAGASAGYFAVKVGQVEGDLWAGQAYAEYRFARNLGFGVAVDAFDVDISADVDDWKGGVHYRNWGPQLYLRARF